FQAGLTSMMASSSRKGAEAAGSAHGPAATGGAAAAVADVPSIGTALEHGSVVLAAITSCTNTSNPSVMIGAGLLAKKAVEAGLTSKPWVKTSLAPGSKVVTEYYEAAGLDRYLDDLGFQTVGYGCTTCIGNSGPLPDEISKCMARPTGNLFAWGPDSTSERQPPYFEGMSREPGTVDDFAGARCLVRLGDSVTTDHISPAGAIKLESPAGAYLVEHGVE